MVNTKNLNTVTKKKNKYTTLHLWEWPKSRTLTSTAGKVVEKQELSFSPDPRGSVGGETSCKLKGHRFDSSQGTCQVAGLVLIRDKYKKQPIDVSFSHQYFYPSPPSFLLSLKTNKKTPSFIAGGNAKCATTVEDSLSFLQNETVPYHMIQQLSSLVLTQGTWTCKKRKKEKNAHRCL